MPERAGEWEIRELDPIISALLMKLDPKSRERYRRRRDAGGAARVVVLRRTNVDIIALARIVRDLWDGKNL
jgi:hypothetical protein